MSTELHPMMPVLKTQQMLDAAMLCFEDRMTDQEIADHLGIARRTLNVWKNREDFSEALQGFAMASRHHAYQHLQNAAERAVHTLLSLMEAGSEPIRLKACLEVLRMLRIDETPPEPQQQDAVDITAFMKTVIEGQVETADEAPL